MDPISIESRLVAATVYGDLARVSREGRVDLKAGTIRIAWPDVPADVNPADVRVETDLGWVRAVETTAVTVAPPDKEAPATEDLRRRLHGLVATQEALRAELELLEHVMPPHGEGSASLRPDLFVQGLEAITRRRRDALAELRRATTDHLETSRALEKDEALQRERHQSHRQTLVVTLQTDTPGACRVRVTYASGWATWRPLYHLQINPGAESVEIVRFADVWQDTGEDWTQIELRLSTAEPEAGLQLPSVEPWFLEVSRSLDHEMKTLYARRPETAAPATPPSSTSATQIDIDAAPVPASSGNVATIEVTGDFETPDDDFDDSGGFAEYATQFDDDGVFADVTGPGLVAARVESAAASAASALQAAPPRPTSEDSWGAARPVSIDRGDRTVPGRGSRPRDARAGPLPREASGGIDVEIPVDRSFDARTGADRHRVQLGRRAYPLRLWYVLRPALRDHAFGRARIVNEDPDPILAGPTALFVGGAFFGHNRLVTTPSRGELVLDVGAETSLQCARRAEMQVRREGLITKDEVHAVDVTIDLESFLPVPADLEVQDQVPVATDTQVRVRLLSTDPEDAELDEETGLVTFSLRLQPHSKRQVLLTYEVAAPSGFRLSQGLSREVTL